jgi:hypothetical protein
MRPSSLVPLVLGSFIATTAAVVPLAPRAIAGSVTLPSSRPALMYLTWHAPWGQPGATQQLSFTKTDSTRVDTLFLSFDPGANAPGFIGLSAVLYFWPAPGDTLGSFWHFERDGDNSMSCQVSFDVTGYEAMSPWKNAGMGLPRYDHTRKRGRLPFVYAVPAGTGTQLEAHKVYCLGRVLISHRRSNLSGYRQPMCIEWGDGEFGLTTEVMAEGTAEGASNVVTWNSPNGAACEGMGKTRGAAALPDSVRGWKSVGH